MFTRLFWIDALERSIKTVAQMLVTLLLAGESVFNVLTVNWEQAIGVALGAGVISILTSIASATKAGTDTASLVVDTKELK